MNTRTQINNMPLMQRRTAFCLAILLLVINVGCVPVRTQPLVQSTPTAIAPSPTPAPPSPTATVEALIPAGWMTYTSQRCEYALSYPADMQVSNEGAYSHSFSFNLANPDEGARNFVYVSVINQDIQSPTAGDIYNYDPAEASRLLDLQIGESQPVRDISDVAEWFTYQRQPDTTIGGYAAKTYENLKPWEFPGGTKEIRYYLSQNGCSYQIGGYLVTTQSNQPGAITEDLFHRIVATMRVMP
jgi:hypothetical protein